MGSTGGDVGRPAPYPSPFYQSLSNPKKPQVPPTSPMCLSASCLSSKPLLDLPIPTQLSFHGSLPAVFHDFIFHDFGTSLPYKSFISSRRLQKKRRIPHQHQQDLHGDDASLPNPMSFN